MKYLLYALILSSAACGRAHQGDALEGGVLPPAFCWTDLPPEGFPTMGAAFQPASSACGGDPCIALHFSGDPRCVEGMTSCTSCPSAGPCVTTSDPSSPHDLSRMFCSTACIVDSDCPPDHTCSSRYTGAFDGGPFCVPNAVYIAVGGCRSNDDCGSGLTCNVAQERCCLGSC